MSRDSKFRIINAGLPKTATKTWTACLEILGFKVADITETIEHFHDVWLDVIENGGDMKNVISKYDELGYDACCDLPGNAFWKELYENMDNCKVILTVRKNESVWANSYANFFRNQGARFGLIIYPFYWFNCYGWVGKVWEDHYKLVRLSLDKQIGIGYAQPRDIAWTQTYFTVISNVAKEFLEKQYIKHNETVKKTVPKEDLLVWNVEEGWEPLCSFLNVPVPDVPIPVMNQTSNTTFFDKYFENRISKDTYKGYLPRIGLFLLLSIFIVYGLPIILAYILYTILF